MTRYLVAVRRGDGRMERAPQPVGVYEVLALLRRLKPYQELHVAVLAPPTESES